MSKRVSIPDYIAKYVEIIKENLFLGKPLTEAFEVDHAGDLYKTTKWLEEPGNQIKLFEAITNGYVVTGDSKEKMYYIKDRLTGEYLYKDSLGDLHWSRGKEDAYLTARKSLEYPFNAKSMELEWEEGKFITRGDRSEFAEPEGYKEDKVEYDEHVWGELVDEVLNEEYIND